MQHVKCKLLLVYAILIPIETLKAAVDKTLNFFSYQVRKYSSRMSFQNLAVVSPGVGTKGRRYIPTQPSGSCTTRKKLHPFLSYLV